MCQVLPQSRELYLYGHYWIFLQLQIQRLLRAWKMDGAYRQKHLVHFASFLLIQLKANNQSLLVLNSAMTYLPEKSKSCSDQILRKFVLLRVKMQLVAAQRGKVREGDRGGSEQQLLDGIINRFI